MSLDFDVFQVDPKPIPDRVYITHPHADHFLGLPDPYTLWVAAYDLLGSES